jgi:hypothetical protein
MEACRGFPKPLAAAREMRSHVEPASRVTRVSDSKRVR